MQRKKNFFDIFSMLSRFKIAEKIVQDMAFVGVKIDYVAGIREYQSVEIVIDCNKRFHFVVKMSIFHIF